MLIEGYPDEQRVTNSAFFCDTITPELLLEIMTSLTPASSHDPFCDIIVENRPTKYLKIDGDK